MRKASSWATQIFLSIVFFLPSDSFCLTDNEFETFVRAENAELKALFDRKEALRAGQEEAELIYGWNFIGGANKRFDKRQSNDPSFTYDSIETNGAQVGLQKQFSFGLESKFSLNSTQTKITNGVAGTRTFNSTAWETQPILDLKFPLLSGGFGRKIRADYQVAVIRRRLQALEAEIAYDSKMNEAKTLLWSTVLQRGLLAAQTETLNRIEKIYSIVQKKAAQNLEASSNFLLAKSALESTDLELRSAQLRFSQLERLLNVVIKEARDIKIPIYNFNKFKKVELSNYNGRVTAQEKQTALSEELLNQSSVVALELNRSRLDLVASVALSGQDREWNDSFAQAQKGTYPTQFIGVQWVVPLDQGITSRGIERQELLSQASTARKTYLQTEQRDADLQDLVSRFNQMVDMLTLNLKLEKTQAEKLKNERQLLAQGRSSIYQVLQFELDLARVQAGKFSLAIDLEKANQQLSLYRYASYE
jgi:hypothetical protein